MALPDSPRCAITGAGSGFGRALAIELARRRAHLVLSDIDEPVAEGTVKLAREAGASSVRAIRCDVTRLEDVKAFDAACEGTVNLLVNNAGVSSAGRVGDLSLDDWRWTLDVDLLGVIYGCHVFVPRLRAQGHGHILNVASAAGLLAAPNMGAYNVAKAGVIALSETLASELAGTGVGVTVTCPMFFRSNIAKNGRFADSLTRVTALRAIENGKDPAHVARAALATVDAGKLYSVPMADGRWLWRLKRLSPPLFHWVLAKVLRGR